ncbi:MAG: hypothetical protein MUO85_02845 [candidate division Zixibacteria bacterium]|nr:hypothetical protein [candidate division Zixibacteria bacterium]
MTRKTRLFLFALGFCLCVFLVSSLIIGADPNKEGTRYVYSLDSKGIHRWDTKSNERKIIFDTFGLYNVSFSLSPSDTILALIVTERGVTPPGAHDYSILPKNSLVFINSEGKEIGKLNEDIRRFSWSPDGNKIAYITGTYYEGGVGFKTTGVYIFDLKDGSKKQITKDFAYPTIEDRGKEIKGGGYDLNWAIHDSNIYIEEFGYLGGNYMYNTKTGKTEKVAYKGIDFSQDGLYYITQVWDMPKFRLYRSKDNDDLSSLLTPFNRLCNGNIEIKWIKTPGHLLLLTITVYEENNPPRRTPEGEAEVQLITGIKSKTNYVFDVETNKVIKKFTGSLGHGWIGNENRIIVEREGKIVFEELPSWK